MQIYRYCSYTTLQFHLNVFQSLYEKNKRNKNEQMVFKFMQNKSKNNLLAQVVALI